MFNAGMVAATLQGNFSPAGFMAFDGAMKKSAATMASHERQMTASGSRMSKGMAVAGKVGGLALAGGVLAAGVAISKSISLAADFEAELSRLKATTSANGAQMQQFKKDAMAAGAATKFSALDAAKAQVELAKGGLAVKDMGGGLKAALALAAAGEMDLAEAATTTVNAMKMFNIDGAESMHVADALATAANTTTADVEDFAMALRQGGAAAKTAGVDFDGTVAMLEALADSSYKNSDAGTSLKTALIQLASPTKKQKEAAAGLNLELWDQNENLKPLPKLAAELDRALGGMTAKQRIAATTTLAGTDGFRALMAIYESSPAKMQSYLDGLKEEGTAAEVAAEKQDNLRGKIENLKGSLETAGIQLGEGLLPGLTDGAEKLTKTINEMSASGDLEKMGKDLGDIASAMIEAGPAIATGLGGAITGISKLVEGLGVGFNGFVMAALAPVEFLLTAVLGLGKAWNAMPFGQGAEIDLGGLERTLDKVNDFRQKFTSGLADLATKDAEVKIKIKGDPAQAVAALKRVQGMGISDKVLRILGRDGDAKSKVRALIALGIPAKTARILANNAQAIAAVGSTQAAINSLQGKTVNVNVITTSTNIIRNKIDQALGKAAKRATGRGPGGAETALTGEGVGAELYGNLRDGFRVVDQPTLVSLKPEDSVIPFGDPSQSGRALELMLDMFGIKGYKTGKAPAKKAAPKRLPIPAAVQFGAVPEDELDRSRDQAREAYQKRKDRVHDLDVDIRAQQKRVGQAKAGPARRKAQAKLADLKRDRKRYNDGGGGYTSLAKMRAQWQALQRQATALHAYNRDIERLNTLQETDRTRMSTAAKTGDAKGWGNAKKSRDSILDTLRKKYAAALKLAKNPNFKADLEAKLASIEGEIADSAADAFVQESPFEGGLSKAERDRLAELQAGQSLAALTTGLADDQATAGATLSFLETMLGAAQADPSRGGAAAVRDLADQVRQARDNVASFATGGSGSNDNADLSAQLAQRDEQLRVARREAEINAQSLDVFRGTGDLGSSAWRPQVVVNQTVNTLHPGDPATQRAIGDAAVGGMNLQPARQSPRTDLGL